MNSTKMHHLTNADILREVDDKRQYSPVIDELCQRLETMALICPCCEADIVEAAKELG